MLDDDLKNRWRLKAYELAVKEARAGGVSAPTLDMTCTALNRELAGIGVVATVLSSSGAEEIIGSSDPTNRLGEVHFEAGQGPAYQAFGSHHPVLVPDLHAAFETWPGYVSTALQLEARSVFAFPLGVGAGRIGALTAYRPHIGSLTEDQTNLALGTAENITWSLLDSHWQEHVSGAEWNEHFLHRTEVYQAQGMVMMQLGISLTEAIARMRAHAFTTGLSLTEVASEIVHKRLVLERE